ncbi:MAG: UbiA family prenyltransferase [Candidatus Diapherotrites archaeon]|nr:UbiA family prenyltransferase [Candidatus Diapherotrites archaeon]
MDAKSSSHRPVPSGRVTRKEAVLFSAGLFILGVGLASSINTLAFLIATIFAILLIAYPLYMNKVKYFGNVIVSLGTAVTFIYGAAATGNIPLLIVVLAIAAFFSNMAREVTKDIQDVKKDTGAKRTLPMILGIENAKSFVTWYYILAIIISLGAAYYFKLNYGYLFFAFLGAIIFSQAQRQLNQNRPTKSQKTSKLGMLISLIAFIMAGFK